MLVRWWWEAIPCPFPTGDVPATVKTAMKTFVRLGLLLALELQLPAQLILSGNENKIDLTSGLPRWVAKVPVDTLTILDFKTFPPRVEHLSPVSNSVIGPPSNIAVTPNGALALIADSIKVDPQDETKYVPHDGIHILDLAQRKVIGSVAAGLQPSGISIARDGKLALVANRAGGTVSVLKIHDRQVSVIQTVKVCEPELSPSDVAISPDGTLGLVSIQKGGYLAVLTIEGDHVSVEEERPSVYGQPYRCVITPDGRLGLTAGQGFGNGLNADALSVVDLKSMRTVDHIPLGSGPESIELSPDGKLLAAVLMNGSNLPPDDPKHVEHGGLVLLARAGDTFKKVQELHTGRIPEGVAFTSDGKHLIVQAHPQRELWIYAVKGKRLKDTGTRIPVPGMPSSLRAGP